MKTKVPFISVLISSFIISTHIEHYFFPVFLLGADLFTGQLSFGIIVFIIVQLINLIMCVAPFGKRRLTFIILIISYVVSLLLVNISIFPVYFLTTFLSIESLASILPMIILLIFFYRTDRKKKWFEIEHS